MLLPYGSVLQHACKLASNGGSVHDSKQAKIERRREELTQATLDQHMDEIQLYYDTLGDYPKGRVYAFRSNCRKKRRFGYPGASTS
ncbi:hypothetical protein Sjap_026112 [Stephania japonica]|uniref:Uncharacterized protein n=1 Tax=Stephania japonica TaxID=461633 RepID=A0AAP0E309_9MAGN